MDYQREAQDRVRHVLDEMERSHSLEVESLRKEIVQLEEKLIIREVEWKEQEQRRIAEQAEKMREKMAEERKRAIEDAALDEQKQNAKEKLHRFRVRLEELWDALVCVVSERR